MKILIDIGHPAHVHLFKNFAIEMGKKGHDILFTCRDKEFEILLLRFYNLKYVSFGRKYNSTLGKLWGMLKFDIRELVVSLKFKPDLFLSHGSPYAAHASFILRKPHISMEDTFNFEQIRLYKPFTKFILTSDYDHPLKSDKVVKYPGYHELAYLHPKRFEPDKSILNELGVKENEKYVILRFVSWNASHDIGHKGVSDSNKVAVVNAFSKHAKIFITSEGALPIELERFRFKLSPIRMHHAMAFASLVYGESATMVAEGAMLGVPGIYLDDTGRYYTRELESRFNLVYNYTESEEDQIKSIEKGVEILSEKNIKEAWLEKRDNMLNCKTDTTDFLVSFIEGVLTTK